VPQFSFRCRATAESVPQPGTSKTQRLNYYDWSYAGVIFETCEVFGHFRYGHGQRSVITTTRSGFTVRVVVEPITEWRALSTPEYTPVMSRAESAKETNEEWKARNSVLFLDRLQYVTRILRKKSVQLLERRAGSNSQTRRTEGVQFGSTLKEDNNAGRVFHRSPPHHPYNGHSQACDEEDVRRMLAFIHIVPQLLNICLQPQPFSQPNQSQDRLF
jgi:hypothetical protein